MTSAALAYPALESAVAQLVTAGAHPGGWLEVFGQVLAELGPPVAAGRIPRLLAVQRLARVLERWTDRDEARFLAEGLPLAGASIAPPRELAAPEPPPPNRPDATPAGELAQVGPVVDVCRFDSIKHRHPVHARVPWPRLAARLTRFEVYPSKEAAPLWSPTRYAPGTTRGRRNVELVSCLVLDFDSGVGWDEVLPRWAGTALAVHTSWSHTPEHPKWRLVAPLAAPVEGARWGLAWHWAAERSGLANDEKCKDASRIYYVPCSRSADAVRVAFVLEGAPVRVPGDVLHPVPRAANPWVDGPPRRRAERSAAQGRRGELYRLDEGARRELGEQLGGHVAGQAVKGVRCPDCGRPSISWWIPIGPQLQARCNHRNSCGASFWLDELESAL